MMENLKWSIIFVIAVFLVKNTIAGDKHFICYYGTWATYRQNDGKFDVANVDVDLCTQIVYTFMGIDNDGNVISLDPYLDLAEDFGRDNLRAFTALKQKNPKVKAILAVGGWNEGSAKYSTMAANSTLRKNFIDSALKWLKDYDFDGFDIDWEYPNRRDSVNGQADVDNFSQLLKEMKPVFEQNGLSLSVAVAAVESVASLAYDVPALSQYVDTIGLMTYDLYGAWDPETGYNAPLHRGEGYEDTPRELYYSVDVAVEYWLKQGCPPEKLVVGIPFYGHTFKLVNADQNTVRSPSSGPGISGTYTQESGLLAYHELCPLLQTQPWGVRRDDLAKVPYAVNGLDWLSYDDPQSVADKVQYVLKNNLGGVMVWSIESDDFKGLCGEKNPLLNSINKTLNAATDDSSELTSVSTSSTASATTESTSTSSVSSTSTAPSTSTASSTSTAPLTSTASSSLPTSSTASTSSTSTISSTSTAGSANTLKSLQIHVPKAILSGEDAELMCAYELEGAQLYSIRWYRNMVEFYRYVPKESPATKVFPVAEIKVDVAATDQNRVVVTNVDRSLTGEFQCEVSADPPLFHTDGKSADMVVVGFTAHHVLNNSNGYASSQATLELEAAALSPVPTLMIRCEASIFDVWKATSHTIVLRERSANPASALGRSFTGAAATRLPTIMVLVGHIFLQALLGSYTETSIR